MKTLDQKIISDLLTKNYINRNTQLATFIRLINSLEGSHILAIDGAWGSGKTVFVKQLNLLCDGEEMIENIPDIDALDTEELRENYTSIYYNAWENDYFDDALQSILYNLIAKIDKTSGGLTENSQKVAASKIDIQGLVKNISHDAINLNGKTDNEALTTQIREFVDRKDKIKDVLQQLVDKREKKILFVVDELDRCSPAFAVKVLEVIKHYFEVDGIMFVVAINTEQLAHTVKKFYGNDFDGYSYLNKFFDFPFSLKAPDVKQFIERYLGRRKSSQLAEVIPADIAQFLHMSMREIESYFASLDLVKDYMKSEQHYYQGSMAYLAQLVLTPLALAIKIKSISDYKSFIIGNNSGILVGLLSTSNSTQHFVDSLMRGDQEKSERLSRDEWLKEEYVSLFNHRVSGDHHAKEIQENFSDIINLISSYTTIPIKKGDVSSK